MAITEAQTRAELSDAQLGASGWNVKDPTQVVEEFDILTSLPDGIAEPRTKYEGHQFSDYVLLETFHKQETIGRRTSFGGGVACMFCVTVG